MTFIGSFHHLLIWFYRLKIYTISILRKRSLYKDTGNFDVKLFVVFLGVFFGQLMILKNVTENFIDGSDGQFVDFLSSLK